NSMRRAYPTARPSRATLCNQGGSNRWRTVTDLPVATDMDALPSTMIERVIRALDAAYYEWTVGSEKIRVSSALADMFGLDPDTWTVKRQTELIHPDDRPGFRAALAAGFKSGAERVEFTY